MNQLLRLEGCTPEPLMSYLKALGVLRLVSEQEDSNSRGCWCDGVFAMETKLDGDELLKFFLERYSPTPLLAPWNGGSGFYGKLDLDKFLETGGKEIVFKGREAVDAIDKIEASDSERLVGYRWQIQETKRVLAALAEKVDFSQALEEPLRKWPQARSKREKDKVKGEATKKILNTMLLFRSGDATFSIGKAAKDEFVSDLRSKVLTDEGLLWLDAALAMRTGQKKNRVEAPTLGSGGNIGNSDFSARFAQLMPEIMPLRMGEAIPEGSVEWLDAALFGSPAPNLRKASIDQFDPGKAGGANGTQGMEAAPMLNPWEYVLMLEGAITLAGNTSRRLGAGRTAASFPFVVTSSPAGHGAVGMDSTRGEVWLPLWSALALLGEVKYLLSEGRAEVGRMRAWSGLTFVQAVAGLGVDRGIRSFVRYEFQERLGQSYIATPVGHFDVPQAPLNGIELVRALNPWLDSFRYACRTKQEGAKNDPPPRFPASLRRIEAVVFEFCKYGGPERLASILAALGNAERQLAVGNCEPEKRRTRRPLGGLPSGWLTAADDQTHEFKIARALALLHPGKKGTGSIRRHLEPVEYNAKSRSWFWSEGGGHVVWGSGVISHNLSAVIVRRVMDAEKNGEPVPPFDSPFPASLDDLAAFLHSDIDETKLEDLLWGLSLIQRGDEWEVPRFSTGTELPRAYALMKLTLLPGQLNWVKSPNGDPILRLSRPKGESAPLGVVVNAEPAIFAMLRAGNARGACEVAARRLRSSGLNPIGGFLSDGTRRAIDWSADGVSSERLLAALLLPLPDYAVNELAALVLRFPSTDSLA